MRFALGVEYDGAVFSGWQRQASARSVQAEVETALARVADHEIQVTCAGRTDAGVHASGQIIHFDTSAVRPPRAWVLGTNSALGSNVAIVWAQRVDDTFHARFSATARRYCYVICNRQGRPGLWSRKLTFVPGELDVTLMHRASRCLLGEHDFSSFRAAGCQSRHARRNVRAIDIERDGDYVYVHVTANAFVQHMVRNIVGTLLRVGQGRETPDWVERVLRARDRTVAGVTAAPDGLYLVAVEYPACFGLPQVANAFGPRFPG